MSDFFECIGCVCMYGGWIDMYIYVFEVCGCMMCFGVFLLLQVEQGFVFLFYWFLGLICMEENFLQKLGVQCMVVELGIVFVVLDILLCGFDLFGEYDDWDFGSGVGFYVDVMQEFWLQYYWMYDYVVCEFLQLIEGCLLLLVRCLVLGYFMGGYGVIVVVLCNFGYFELVFVFVLICVLMCCFWGEKVFFNYFGDDWEVWKVYDFCELLCEVESVLVLFVD